MILVAPVWKGQTWYPVLLEILRDYTRLIPPQESLLQREGVQRIPEITPQLANGPVSGRDTESVSFLQKLRTSCSPPGERSPHSHTNPTLASGLTGMQNEVVIPFSGPVADVANFLAHLHYEGYQSQSLNAYRSAISSVHDAIDGVEVKKHPMVSRLLKGAYRVRPPLPIYMGCTSDIALF